MGWMIADNEMHAVPQSATVILPGRQPLQLSSLSGPVMSMAGIVAAIDMTPAPGPTRIARIRSRMVARLALFTFPSAYSAAPRAKSSCGSLG